MPAKLRLFAALLVVASAGFAQNPATAAFPTSVATDTTLGVACNSARSTLAVDLSALATTATVADGTKFCYPSYITSDSEVMKVTGISGNTLTITRAVHGAAAIHVSGTTITGFVDMNYINQANAEIKAIESGLGAGFVNTFLLNRSNTVTSDNAYDLGAAASGRLRSLYIGSSFYAGGRIYSRGAGGTGNPTGKAAHFFYDDASNYGNVLAYDNDVGAGLPLALNRAGGNIWAGASADDNTGSKLQVNGGVSLNGTLKFVADGTQDIGGSSTTNRPRNGHFSGTVYAGTFSGSGASLTSVPWGSLTSVPSTFTPSAHTHPVTDLSTVGDYSSKITSGTYSINVTGSAASLSANLPTSKLNGGTNASAGTFWRGDGTWAAVPAATPSVVTASGNYTVTAGSNVAVMAAANSGNITVTLFTAVGNTGAVVRVKRTDNTANTLTIATTSSQTIDGNSTVQIYRQYDALTLMSDGTNWSIM